MDHLMKRLRKLVDNTPNYADLYRDSETYAEYMSRAKEIGADLDEASEMWSELTSKYESH